ncbi:MAG: hypothetical protein M3422_12535, partial [Actinomycetota bacterium]|nr:hypothetical protein [Actinomycetota bacterium]
YRRTGGGGNTAIAGATQSTYTAAPTETTHYWVMASNACRPGEGGVLSDEVVVSVDPACVLPTVGDPIAKAVGNDRWELSAVVSASEPSISWTNPATGAVVGTTSRITVGPVTATTVYRITVTQPCSNATVMRTVTVEVPLHIPATLEARQAGGLNAIDITWLPSAGAAQYRLERRSGAVWNVVGTLTATSYRDPAIVAGRTYAYRVAALDSSGRSDSGYSNADVATIISFTQIAPGDTVEAAPYNEMLSAVNAVRGAVGWPAVSWADVIGPSQPLPQPGTEILAAHVAACRARMNEALQALGVPVVAYTDPDLSDQFTRAIHVQEVQGRVR